jgi:hypothetical protein
MLLTTTTKHQTDQANRKRSTQNQRISNNKREHIVIVGISLVRTTKESVVLFLGLAVISNSHREIKDTLAFSPHCTHFVTPGTSLCWPWGCSKGIHKLFAPMEGALESSGASASTRPLLFSLTSSSHSSLSPISGVSYNYTHLPQGTRCAYSGL